MGAAIVPLIMALAVLVVGAAGLAVNGRRLAYLRDQVLDPGAVRYGVPHGQDPASVLAGLQRAGYEAVLSSADLHTLVAVRVDSCDPRAREGIRTVIAHAPLNLEGDRAAARDVRFLDE
ncbi:MAG: hypothetical protein ACRDO4_07325 [Nocardioides sp.]